MVYRPPVAVYDACVLYPFHLRNLLVQCAHDRLVEAHWTDEIHDEWIRNLVASNPSIREARLLETRDKMNRVLPYATVTNYRHHINKVHLPDPDDRHVVAAAIAARASLIVTSNIRDFPAAELEKHGLRRRTPDAFLMDIYSVVPAVLVAATASARRNLTKSSLSAIAYIEELRNQKLSKFAAVLETYGSGI